MASKNRRPHPNGNFPLPPPKRTGRSTFDGFPCAVTAFLILAGALVTIVGGPIAAAYLVLH
jgi:hypothetical protein